MRRLCVFCGSNPGHDPVYRALAEEMGRVLAREGIGIVFGGGRIGLMGAVADAVLAARGEVIGVIPQAFMEREIGHTGLTELRVVGSMHERKALMADLVDGFVELPGGIGTLEELIAHLPRSSGCDRLRKAGASGHAARGCLTRGALGPLSRL